VNITEVKTKRDGTLKISLFLDLNIKANQLDNVTKNKYAKYKK